MLQKTIRTLYKAGVSSTSRKAVSSGVRSCSRRVATPALFSRGYAQVATPDIAAEKETTGLTGVEVQPHGREILTKLYEKILADAKAATADEPSNPYIEYLESAYLPRLQILRETKSILEIEDKMGDGQIEEMIMDAEAELSLIPQMARDRPWNTKKWHSVPVLHSKIDE